MGKPYLNTANLSSTMMHTQPSTLLPYFSLNKIIRECEIVAIATKGTWGNKGLGNKVGNFYHSVPVIASIAKQSRVQMENDIQNFWIASGFALSMTFSLFNYSILNLIQDIISKCLNYDLQQDFQDKQDFIFFKQ